MKKSLVFFALLMLALVSCEKEIEYQGEGKEPLLVLDALLEINAPPQILLTRSIFFLSNNQYSDVGIAGATVKLTDLTNGIEYSLTPGGSIGYYSGSTSILPNTHYRIEISHPKYPSISSEMTTVSEVNLLDMDTASVSETFSTRYFIDLTFQDPSATNFYGISMFSKRKTTYYDYDTTVIQVDTTSYAEYPETKDPSFSFYRSGVWFTDTYFNGVLKNFEVEVFPNTYAYQEEVEILSWTGVLTNMSEDAFKYFKSIGNNQPNGPFNDPSNVYTNVKNGLGIFGSYSRSSIEK